MAKLDESYHVLGIDPGATPEDVEDAYGELAKVWGPERFPNDDHIRRIAEKKMADIEAARDALLSFLSSEGNARPRAEIDRGASLLDSACDNPGCTGVLDRNGICYVCGQFSAPSRFRYTVFCSACGTRNVIASQKDHDRAICAGCRMPLGPPVRIKQKSSRKTAYCILLVVIFALAWFFFSPENPQDPVPKKAQLNTQASQPSSGIPAEKAVEAQVPPRAEPEVLRVQSVPDPPRATRLTGRLTAPGATTEGTGELPQGPARSENAVGEKKVPAEEARAVPAEENSGPQPIEQAVPVFTPESKEPKPVEQAGRIAAGAGKDTAPVEVRPGSPDERGKENYDRLIDEVAKKKAPKPQGKTGELRELPFGKLKP